MRLEGGRLYRRRNKSMSKKYFQRKTGIEDLFRMFWF